MLDPYIDTSLNVWPVCADVLYKKFTCFAFF